MLIDFVISFNILQIKTIKLKSYRIEIGKLDYNKITINNNSLLSKMYYEVVSKLYLSALEKLDKDVENQYNNFKKQKYTPFFIFLTYDIYRDDGIKDTVLDYFIMNLAIHFSKKSTVDVVFYRYPGINVLNHLKSIKDVNIVVKSSFFETIKKTFRNQFGPIKVLFIYFTILIKKEMKENEAFKLTANKHVFLTNLAISQTRWKDYPNSLALKEKQGYFLDVNLKQYSDIHTNRRLNIKLFTRNNLIIAVKDSYNIFRISQRDKNAETSIFQQKVINQSFLQTLTVVWRFYAWETLFIKYSVTDIHVMTTFGDPFKRLPLAVAKRTGVVGHIFACRPYLSSYRSEDRIISIDTLEESICQIPNDIIVLDKYSQNQLTKFGVVASIYNPISKSIKITADDGLLLLFSDATFNVNIIKLISRLKGLKLNLYIREHPLVKLDDHLKEQLLLTGNSVTDLNQYDWSELHFRNVLTFSANTTAGLDAIARGCDLFWLPFLSQNFLQFAGYANDTGKVIFCEKEWILAVNEYFKTK
jgi:hypothetical protein